jgi:hypothetical protein
MIIEYTNTIQDLDTDVVNGEVTVDDELDIQGINDWLDANVGNIYTWNFKE